MQLAAVVVLPLQGEELALARAGDEEQFGEHGELEVRLARAEHRELLARHQHADAAVVDAQPLHLRHRGLHELALLHGP